MGLARLLFPALLLLGCGGEPPGVPVNVYPDTLVGDTEDDYFGTRVQDPYRWLEQLESPEVASWVDLQNEHAEPVLEALPYRDEVRAAVDRAIRYQQWGLPTKRADTYVYSFRDGEANQPVIMVTSDLSEAGRVLLDPNVLSDDGTVALSSYELSPDGRFLAYSLSDGGTDWRTWHVLEVESGQKLDEVLSGIKFSDVSWSSDSSGFYYSRYPMDANGVADDQSQVSIYRHTLGTPQEQDEHIYSIEDHPTRNPYGTVSEDGHYLVIGVFDGFDSDATYYMDLRDEQPEVVRLLDEWDARYEFLGNDGGVFYFKTDADAPKGRIIAVDLERPEKAAWRLVAAEGDNALEAASYVGGRFVLTYLQDAHSKVVVVDDVGKIVAQPELPGLGTATGFRGRYDDQETFFVYEDFVTRETVYRYEIGAEKSERFWGADEGTRGEEYQAEQVFATSRDGTRIPAFVVRKTGVELNGRLPVLLYGYGGFNISLSPSYGAVSRAWVELGGVFVSANLRGGGEYGSDWHDAGTKLKKQNVFDDFFAVAEWLIDAGYTSRDRLAIMGRSNGGLLVGAAMTQRPDLYAAALPGVGVLDMLRYHTASANARAWSSDYGLSEREHEFQALYAYSPYHQVKGGICYPPTLVTTADRDDRVVPWHSYKFAARLQAAQGCASPILLRVETRAGHGAGKPVSMIVDDYTDQLAFAAWALKFEPS